MNSNELLRSCFYTTCSQLIASQSINNKILKILALTWLLQSSTTADKRKKDKNSDSFKQLNTEIKLSLHQELKVNEGI